jgi:Surface lipoprotein
VAYKFNTTADKYVLRPVARGYVDVTPAFARQGLNNLFSNLLYPKVIINDFLQLKMKQGAEDTARFFYNTTVGLGGFLDVATPAGLPRHDEDFGQTLGYWGVGTGWYLMLPLLGPSDNRDLVGTVVDTPMNPLFYVNVTAVTLPIAVVHIVNLRANLLGTEALLKSQFDPYIFVRTAYLERRRNLVYDGNPPPTPLFPEDSGDSDDDTGSGNADSSPASGKP